MIQNFTVSGHFRVTEQIQLLFGATAGLRALQGCRLRVVRNFAQTGALVIAPGALVRRVASQQGAHVAVVSMVLAELGSG